MFFVIIIKGLGKVVDLVFDYLEKYLYNFLYYKYYKKIWIKKVGILCFRIYMKK